MIKEQNKLLDKQTKIETEPVVDIYFENDIDEKYYSIVINNSGSTKITDINIWREYREYDTQLSEYGGATYRTNSWKKLNFLENEKQKKFEIDYDELWRAWLFNVDLNKRDSTIMKKDRYFPFFLFKISYKREGDRKEYRIKKFLFLTTRIHKGKEEMEAYDPDQDAMYISSNTYDGAIYSRIKEREKEETWNRGRSYIKEKNK